jgi:hypothetical protein
VSWNNRFEGNHYELPTAGLPFFWMGLAADEWQWQAYGLDTAATLSTFTR